MNTVIKYLLMVGLILVLQIRVKSRLNVLNNPVVNYESRSRAKSEAHKPIIVIDKITKSRGIHDN